MAAPASTRAESSPPGYAPPRERPLESAAGAPPFWFFVLLGASVIAALHEILVTQPAAYLDPGIGPRRWLASSAGGAGFLLGALATRRHAASAREWLPVWLAGASLAATASAFVLFFAFANASLLGPAAIGVPLGAGFALGGASACAVRALGRPVAALGGLERALDPFRILGLAAMLCLAAAAAAVVGLLRSTASIGMVLAALAGWCAPLLAFVERRPLAQARLARGLSALAFASGLGAFAAAEALVPLADLAQAQNPIVYAMRSSQSHFVVTSGQEAFELYTDGRLVLSGIDERRYHEALVHPALSLAKKRARVLLIGGGHGTVAREILRHPEVEALVIVVPDATVADLGRRLVWLSERSERALHSPKVNVVEAEPILWLGGAEQRFDVAIVDLPDPATYVDGKSYTRHFYRLLRERLDSRGVAVVQATSPFGSPRTFAGIEHTLRAAGLYTLPYRAPVPTFGEWGFVLAAHGPLSPPPRAELARWLTGSTPPELFALPSDLASKRKPEVSTLFDQSAVHSFVEESEKLGL